MGDILITFIKQSSAYKLKKAALQNGIAAKIVQTPKQISMGGCSYAVQANRKDVKRLTEICREYNIEYSRVIVVYLDMNGKRVYNEI